METLETLSIQKPAGVTDDQGAAGIKPWYAVISALGDRLGAVADHLAAIKERPNPRMGLEPLEFVVRICSGILVVETSDQADVQQPILHHVYEAAAECL